MALQLLKRYARWLHTGVPAGKVERGPVVQSDGSTNLSGVWVVGDLTGVPLLKFACDTGAAAVEKIEPGGDGFDLAIIGAGVAGMAAALAAKKRGLSFVVLESAEPFSTIVNFPKKKPIYTYPKNMTPRGELQVEADVKEALVEELLAQVEGEELPVVLGVSAERLKKTGGGYEIVLKDGAEPRAWKGGGDLPDGWSTPLRAKHVVVALGRSGNFRRLDVPGEDNDKVVNRLHDPAKHGGQKVLVVGGGDSAMEAAVALADEGAEVTLSYRGKDLSRPKPENVSAVESREIEMLLPSNVKEIRDGEVVLDCDGDETTIANDAVFSLIGREPPLDFFRRSGIPIRGENSWGKRAILISFLLTVGLLYSMKMFEVFAGASWNPSTWAGNYVQGVEDGGGDKGLLYTVLKSASSFGFWISLAYCVVVVVFGIRRIRRRKTPYVKLQTITLAAIQCLPLFVLPEIVLPYAGYLGAWDDGVGKTVADALFPQAGYGHGREYWRAYGFILAWPLFIWNVFTAAPLMAWLWISLVQTFVIIPLLIWRWGKGAYCGWICTCGALAETLGDQHRDKMPHGPGWNRLNLVGQGILGIAFALFFLRVLGWVWDAPGLRAWNQTLTVEGWKPVVDFFLASMIGTGLYFWFSGRVWCRFACPLAALMHIYAKFTRYRIFAEKDKCISCNVCTTVCHQGIDVMNFANKGKPMTDVECVRCSACVQECPTGTLSFGRVDADGRPAALDKYPASPVLINEDENRDRVLERLREQ